MPTTGSVHPAAVLGSAQHHPSPDRQYGLGVSPLLDGCPVTDRHGFCWTAWQAADRRVIL